MRHPGLPDDPRHERARSQMAGFGSVLGLRPHGGRTQADDVVERVALWIPATSLNVGIENVDDLWNDLDCALRGA